LFKSCRSGSRVVRGIARVGNYVKKKNGSKHWFLLIASSWPVVRLGEDFDQISQCCGRSHGLLQLPWAFASSC
jgi:hypothetical protein